MILDVAQGKEGSGLVPFRHGVQSQPLFQESIMEIFVMAVAGIWAGVVALSFCMPTGRE